MAALDLGDVADFPFVDPPDRRAVADGLALLEELGALDEHGEAHRRPAGRWPRCRWTRGWPGWWSRPTGAACSRRCWSSPPGLTIQDPRERPTEHQQAADQLHARFADENSDFLALLNLWRYLGEQQDALSRQPVPPHGEAGVPALPAHPRVAGPARPAARHGPPAGHDAGRAGRRARRAGHHRRAAGRAAVARRPAGWSRRRADGKPGAAGPRVPGRPQHPLRDRARHAAGEEAAALGGRRRAGRDQPAVRPHRRADRPRGRSRSWPTTSSSGSTPSRGGTPSAAPSSPPSG